MAVVFGWLDEWGTQCICLVCSAWDECRVIVGLMCRSSLPYQGGLGIHYLTQWSLSPGMMVVMSGGGGGGGGLPWRDPWREPFCWSLQLGTFVNEKVWMYRGERTGELL